MGFDPENEYADDENSKHATTEIGQRNESYVEELEQGRQEQLAKESAGAEEAAKKGDEEFEDPDAPESKQTF